MPDHLFQPWFVELVTVVSNVAVAVTAIVAVILAVRGLQQWRTELLGKAKYDLARTIVVLAYKFQDHLAYVREPFTYSNESVERVHATNEIPAESNIRDEAYARQQRTRILQETVRNLRAAQWEATITLGADIGQLIIAVEEIYSDLMNAMRDYFDTSLAYANRRNPPDDHLREIKNKVYGTPDDKFGQATNRAVESLVERLKVYIR